MDDSADPPAYEERLRQAFAATEARLLTARHEKPSIYTGASGVCYAQLRCMPAAQTASTPDAASALGRLRETLEALEDSFSRSRVSFLEGAVGNVALQAAVRRRQGDVGGAEGLIRRVADLCKRANALDPGECEVLYGRCGYLGAILFLRREFGDATLLQNEARETIESVLQSGQRNARAGWPLYFEWHEKCYFGGAHGIAGILFTLLQFDELPAAGKELVRRCAEALLAQQFPSGNIPSSLGSAKDKLVHWCHGAPGVVPLLLRMADVFGERKYLELASGLGEVVWQRGLLCEKGPGLCHGIPGNGYVLLTLQRYAKAGDDLWLRRARHFACVAADNLEDLASNADRPFSLFEGMAGALVFWHDVLTAPSRLEEAGRFPCYEF
eukprot:TRINITY_DN21961_c0_g1_i3.p1 TRINITY_DN21961_c0_g1~~TRINITY_DN21961_c0_g1_i3.p1  ORF type:complete len:384 (+),score=54.36 TRINITY_DN21961_c0_g1_i3:94-1245(+)